MSGQLLATIGLPRSGKSSIADLWSKYAITIQDNYYRFNPKPFYPDYPRVVICSDDIRKGLHGCRWSSCAEDMVHAIQGVMIRSFLHRGYHVLVDGTHTTKSSIRRLLSFDINTKFCILNTPKETCKKRAAETQQEDLYPIIDRMSQQLHELIGDFDNIVRQLTAEVLQQPKHSIQIN